MSKNVLIYKYSYFNYYINIKYIYKLKSPPGVLSNKFVGNRRNQTLILINPGNNIPIYL